MRMRWPPNIDVVEGFVNCFGKSYNEAYGTSCRPAKPWHSSRRDKLNLDIFWLKDDSLEDMDSPPALDVLAAEIVDNLQAALEQFRTVSAELVEEEGE